MSALRPHPPKAKAAVQAVPGLNLCFQGFKFTLKGLALFPFFFQTLERFRRQLVGRRHRFLTLRFGLNARFLCCEPSLLVAVCFRFLRRFRGDLLRLVR